MLIIGDVNASRYWILIAYIECYIDPQADRVYNANNVMTILNIDIKYYMTIEHDVKYWL